jgi:hypothetical protein
MPGPSFGRGFGSSIGRVSISTASHPRRCEGDLPLYVQLGRERARVGKLKTKTPWILESQRKAKRVPGFIAIKLLGSSISLTDGAQFLVREEDVDEC